MYRSICLLLGALCVAPSAMAAEDPIGGDFRLIDQSGKPFSLAQMRGYVVVLSFGYTFCPDVCPTTLATVAAALHQMGDRSDQVRSIFISLDPDRDTPEHLGPYVRFFDQRMIALTGSAAALADVAKRYGVKYAFVGKGEREHYSMDHTASVYILDQEGRVARIVPFGLPPDEISATLEQLLSRR